MAWALVRHAFAMLFRNLIPALQASIGPILIALAISAAVVLVSGLNPLVLITFAVDPQQLAAVVSQGQVPTGILLAILFLLLVFAFVFAWVCVAWHRFILIEESPGPLPGITGRPIWLYVGTTILLAVLLVLLAIPLSMAGSLIAGPFVGTGGEAGTSAVALVVSLAVNTITSYLWFRFAVVLPAAAIGRPMTLGDGWSATRRIGVSLFGAVVILMVLTFLSGLALAYLEPVNLWISFGAALIVQWITLMMGASILTTIYGVTVERRTI